MSHPQQIEPVDGSKSASLLSEGRRMLAAQPFSALLGTELLGYSHDGAELRLVTQPWFRQQNGYLHGGVIAYLADNALAYAGGSALGMSVVTSEFKINYLRPAIGEELIARATVIHAGRRQAVCQCEILAPQANGGELICAIAQGTIVKAG